MAAMNCGEPTVFGHAARHGGEVVDAVVYKLWVDEVFSCLVCHWGLVLHVFDGA